MKNVAVLLTVFNRKVITLECLKALQEQEITQKVSFEIFLVDDGSTDGTFKEVSSQFPEVNLIKGNGNLFWNGGMRLAWNTALEKGTYDFFLWLNDDTIILENGLNNLFEDYERIQKLEKKPFLITGACKKLNSEEFSYGGRNENGCVVPNGDLQKCRYINGNIVLIPYDVYDIIGALSDKYTHAMGDFDYGLRAQEKKISCFTTSRYVAMCDQNPISGWMDSNVTFKKRWELFHSPKGLNVKEFKYFTRRHNTIKSSLIVYVKIYSQLFFPNLYTKLKNK
jgi:GT2 family glycosyltransferase